MGISKTDEEYICGHYEFESMLDLKWGIGNLAKKFHTTRENIINILSKNGIKKRIMSDEDYNLKKEFVERRWDTKFEFNNQQQRNKKCLKCKYTWISRIRTLPIECPNCKSRYWNDGETW